MHVVQLGSGPAAEAWQLVAAEAWTMLWSGRLRALPALAAGLAWLPGGLAGLMWAQRPDPSYVRGGAAGVEVTAPELLATMRVVAHELPVWEVRGRVNVRH